MVMVMISKMLKKSERIPRPWPPKPSTPSYEGTVAGDLLSVAIMVVLVIVLTFIICVIFS